MYCKDLFVVSFFKQISITNDNNIYDNNNIQKLSKTINTKNKCISYMC